MLDSHETMAVGHRSAEHDAGSHSTGGHEVTKLDHGDMVTNILAYFDGASDGQVMAGK
jgi:hypothetical protein